MAVEILERRFTYTDYKELDVDDNLLYELLEGELVKKSAPSPQHQRVLRNTYDIVGPYVKAKKLGEVFFAPIDVFLDDESVPVPDLVFVSSAKASLVTADGIMGAPDLVVEIISPSSIRRDRFQKFRLYKQFAVTEYWLIDPANQSIEIHHYNVTEKDYDLFSFGVSKGEVRSKVLPELVIAVEQIFGE
jgi:Uma2 family endonuclease